MITVKDLTNKVTSILYSPEFKGKVGSLFILNLSYSDRSCLARELPIHGLLVPVGECDEDTPNFKISCNYGGVIGIIEVEVVGVSYLVDDSWNN